MALIDSDRVCMRNFSCTNDESNGVKLAKNMIFHEALEDGTLPYLEILAVGQAIEKFQELTFGIGFSLIQSYLVELTEHLVHCLLELKHFNGNQLVEIYRREFNGSILTNYGPIVSFNLKNPRGLIGF